MPLHDFLCPCCSHVTEQFVAQGVDAISCEKCAEQAGKVFLRFPHSYVQGDICYDSPVDGRHITSKQARIEDLARNNCVPYEPSMKAEHVRKINEDDERIGRNIERHFDAEVNAMPARKRELLEQELRSGADLEITRSTA